MSKTTEMMLSRCYVEFGPFAAEELTAFAARGLLRDSDHVKEAGGDHWIPCSEWLAETSEPTPKPEPTPAPPLSNAPVPAETPAKAPAKKRAPAKPKPAA